MICACGEDTGVVLTRTLPEGIRRRRQCSSCRRSFYTLEAREDTPRPVSVLGVKLGKSNHQGTRTLRGPGGRGVITGREAELLQVLSEAWPRMVTVPEVRRRMFPNQKVTEGYIKRLREQLGRTLMVAGVHVVTDKRGGFSLARK